MSEHERKKKQKNTALNEESDILLKTSISPKIQTMIPQNGGREKKDGVMPSTPERN